MTAPSIKGISFRSFLDALRSLRGPEVVERVMDALPAEVRDALRFGKVVSGGWYPLGWYRELHAATMQVTEGGLEVIHDVSRLATRNDFKGVYRVIALVLSPESLMAVSSRAFSSYFNAATFEMLETRKGFARARITAPGFNRAMWTDVMAGCEGVLEAAGAKGASVTAGSGGGERDEVTEVNARWT